MPSTLSPPPALTRRLLAALAVLAVLLLSGCAAVVKAPDGASPARLSAPAVATTQAGLLLTASPAMRIEPGWPAFRTLWRKAFSDAASNAGLRTAYFETMPSENLPGTVLVRVTIRDYRHVNTGTRWALGLFTGNAYVDADVEFIELPSRRSLGTRRYSTSSSAWEGVFSAMTDKQVAALAEAMVRELRPP